MATTPLEKLKEQLTCLVCLDLYTNPKTLPCHHSFCLPCLERLSSDARGNTYFIACPTCRHSTQLPPKPAGPAGFPAAFQLNNLMETYIQMNKPQQSCSNHEKLLDIFCETCDQVICLQCTKQNHKNHDWDSVTESYHKDCNELERSLAPVKEKVEAIKNVLTAMTEKKNEITEQSEAVKQEIRVMEEEMISAIRESARQLTREVETVTDGKLKVLSEQKKSAEMSLSYLKDCEEYVEQSIRSGNQQQVLMSKKQMMDHMSQVTQQINMEELIPIEKADVQLIRDSKIAEAAHHIGDIVFTSLQQCKVKEISQIECISDDVSFLLLLECLDYSLLAVPASSIKCSLVPVGSQPITTTVTFTTHPGVYNIHCSPSTHGHYQVNVQVYDVQLEGTSLVIPFNPYLDTITPVRTIGELNGAWGVAVSTDGSHIIVTERMGDCVTILDSEGKKVKSFGGKGESGNVKFTYPRGVAITPDNFILVTDNHRIQKVTMDGECIASVGKEGSRRLKFNIPDGIAISLLTGHIYIADWSNDRIQVLTPDLTFSHSFGKEGSAEGRFQYPRNIAINSKGLLYVTDSGNHRIQVFTPEGQYVAQFGTQGSGPGQLISPVGITIDSSTDLVYVTEVDNHRISIFSSEGHFINSYGKEEKLFYQPTGIQYANGQLYICDSSNVVIL